MGVFAALLIAALEPGGHAESERSRRGDAFSPPKGIPFIPVRAPLRVGEELVYEVRWSGMPAGKAVLFVKWKEKLEGRHEVFKVRLETRSNSFVSIFYPVSTEAESFIDVEGSFSRLFWIRQNEGRIQRKEKVIFDYDRKLALYPAASSARPRGELVERSPSKAASDAPRPEAPVLGVRGKLPSAGSGPVFDPEAQTRRERVEGSRVGRPSRGPTVKVRLNEKVQDPLSCLYYVRLLDLRVGEFARMAVHTCRRRWLLGVRVLKKEKIDLPGLGEFSAVKIQPEAAFPGVFVRKGRMTVWLEERTRVPLMMMVDIPIGSVKVLLVEARGSPLVAPGKD